MEDEEGLMKAGQRSVTSQVQSLPLSRSPGHTERPVLGHVEFRSVLISHVWT